MQGTNWFKTKDKLPTEGEAVIVIFGEHIQNITYELIHCDSNNELRWFPHNNLEHDSAPLETLDYWMYIKDLPLPPMPEGE
ncbi:hypothetical protein [Proteus columbae]|uniref:hypothetical protein n=1 Tax=Proteus columbae TaxID=1987580 RepID=UPI002889FDD0|nr:hypothetical protein [Proteus columbae]